MKIVQNVMVVTVIVGMLVACRTQSSQITIKNESLAAIANIDVEVRGQKIHVSRIVPGDEHTVAFDPISDSSVSMSDSGRSQSRVDCVGDVYVTTGHDARLIVTITGDGACSVADKGG